MSERAPRKSAEATNPWKEEHEVVQIENGSIETIDITPETVTDPVPVLVAPAWGASVEAYRNALETLATQGRRVVSLDHARHGGGVPPPGEVPELLKDLPEEELRKAESLLALLDAKELEKVDVIAHSEGAVNALAAIMLAPERFRNIVLVGPAGLIGDDTPVRLAKSFLKDSSSERKPSLEEIPWSDEEIEQAKEDGVELTQYPKLSGPPFSPRALVDVAKYVASNPSRSAKEVIGIARTRLEKVLEEVHNRGIGVIIMTNVDDPVFPTMEIANMVKAEMIDGFLSMRGGHGELVGKPERFMVAAEEMLRSLYARQEAAKKRNEESKPPL